MKLITLIFRIIKLIKGIKIDMKLKVNKNRIIKKFISIKKRTLTVKRGIVKNANIKNIMEIYQRMYLIGQAINRWIVLDQ